MTNTSQPVLLLNSRVENAGIRLSLHALHLTLRGMRVTCTCRDTLIAQLSLQHSHLVVPCAYL